MNRAERSTGRRREHGTLADPRDTRAGCGSRRGVGPPSRLPPEQYPPRRSSMRTLPIRRTALTVGVVSAGLALSTVPTLPAHAETPDPVLAGLDDTGPVRTGHAGDETVPSDAPEPSPEET